MREIDHEYCCCKDALEEHLVDGQVFSWELAPREGQPSIVVSECPTKWRQHSEKYCQESINLHLSNRQVTLSVLILFIVDRE